MDYNVSFALNSHPTPGELTVLFSGSSCTSPDHQVGPKVHDYHLIHLVLGGGGVFRCRGRSHSLRAGGAFLIFPGELVSYDADPGDPWRYCWVAFNGSKAASMLEGLGWSPEHAVLPDSAPRDAFSMFRRIVRTLQEGTAVCGLQAEGYLRAALAELSKQQGRLPNSLTEPDARKESERQVEQAVRWLSLQYSENVSIERMAQTLGYHRTHLSKLFKQQTGMPPMRFLLQLRMERAKLLLAGSLTIEQVASSVGFEDALYFSRLFRKWCGMSPTEYRQEQRAHMDSR